MQADHPRQTALSLLFICCCAPTIAAQITPTSNIPSKAQALGPAVSTHRSTPWVELVGGREAEVPQGAAEMRNGSLQVCGQVVPVSGGLGDAWVTRLSPSGAVRWHLTLRGPARDEFAAMVPTPDGGSLLAGFTDSFGAGGEDGWLVKLGPKGKVQWQKTYGGVGNDQFTALVASPNGYYVGGVFGTATSGADAWILEVDALGAVLWQEALGGNKSDRIRSLVATPDGLAFVADSNSDFVQPAVPFGRPWLVKLDPQGGVLWQKSYSYSGGDGWGHLTALEDGGFLATGEVLYAAFFRGDAWVVRLDSEGEVLWDRRFGDNFGNLWWDSAIQAQRTPTGGFLIAAITATVHPAFEDIWLIELGGDGSFLDDRVLGGPSGELVNSMIPLRFGGYLVSASTFEHTDALVMSLTAAGTTAPSCAFPETSSAPNIWTGPVSIGVPNATLTATTVVPVDSLAKSSRPADESTYLCEPE